MARILVVDDDAEFRNLVASLLGADHEVEIAADGAEALDRLAGEDIDLVIIDWIMPGVDGPTVVRTLRQPENAYRDLPVIMVTSKYDRDARELSFRAGADSFIPKPFDPVSLNSMVQLHLMAA